MSLPTTLQRKVTLYDKNIIQRKILIGRLHRYFLTYFETFSAPTADTLFLYSFHWNIETSYYEQKTFWSFCSYMVRSCKGIEML